MTILESMFKKTSKRISKSGKAFFNSTTDVCILPEVPSVDFVGSFENKFYKFRVPAYVYVESSNDDTIGIELVVKFDNTVLNNRFLPKISITEDACDLNFDDVKDCIRQRVIDNSYFFEKIRYYINVKKYNNLQDIMEDFSIEYVIYRFRLQNNNICNLVLSVPMFCTDVEKNYAFDVFDAIIATFVVK